MRYTLCSFVIAALLLLGACQRDVSCYRDLIVGTWVEQTFDGQEPETNLRGVHVFDRTEYNRPALRTVTRLSYDENNQRIITDVGFSYLVFCKSISTWGAYRERGQEIPFSLEEEVLRFTDTTLRVRTGESAIREIFYKKVSSDNVNAQKIKNLWEMTQCSDLSVPLFRIRFDDDGTYTLFLESEEEEGEENGEEDDGEDDGEDDEAERNRVAGVDSEMKWKEKIDEDGKYAVYDSFLITSFFNNPIFGAPQVKDVACWDFLFTDYDEMEDEDKDEESKVMQMSWNAIVYVNGQRIEKRFLFTSVLPPAEDS